jgi:hypothetical protein
VLDISPFYSSYYSGKYNMGAPSKIYQLARRGKENKVDVRVERGCALQIDVLHISRITSMFFITKIKL